MLPIQNSVLVEVEIVPMSLLDFTFQKSSSTLPALLFLEYLTCISKDLSCVGRKRESNILSAHFGKLFEC